MNTSRDTLRVAKPERTPIMSSTMTKDERLEARKAKAQKLHNTLKTEVEQLYNSDNWQQYLDCLGKMHRYSFNNIILMVAQLSNVSYVAGYKKWAKLGYQVKKGEKAIKIFGYSKYVHKEEKSNKNGQKEIEETIREYYPLVNVFDYSQVEKIEGKDYLNMPQQVWGDVNGDDPNGLYPTITNYLIKEGWTVEEVDDLDGARGCTSFLTRTISIVGNRSQADKVKTLLHEAAHAYLHEGQDICHRNQKECEAESVAYCVAGALGIDTSAASIGYVTGWLPKKDPESLEKCATNVRKAVHHILEGIEEINSNNTDEASENEPHDVK